MQLQDFYDYKNQLMKQIVTNETLIPLINKDYDLSNAKELIYKQIFPFEYIPETADDGYTYVCFDVDVTSTAYRSSSQLLINPVIYVWVLVHRSNMILPDGGGVRFDKICNEICNMVNGSMLYGLGRVKLYAVKRYAPMTDYNGKVMTFDTTEFSKVFDGKKPIPSNRKNGNVNH